MWAWRVWRELIVTADGEELYEQMFTEPSPVVRRMDEGEDECGNVV